MISLNCVMFIIDLSNLFFKVVGRLFGDSVCGKPGPVSTVQAKPLFCLTFLFVLLKKMFGTYYKMFGRKNCVVSATVDHACRLTRQVRYELVPLFTKQSIRF